VSDVVGLVVEIQIIFLGIDIIQIDSRTKNEVQAGSCKRKKNGVKYFVVNGSEIVCPPHAMVGNIDPRPEADRRRTRVDSTATEKSTISS
jgi:hypothetical protein